MIASRDTKNAINLGKHIKKRACIILGKEQTWRNLRIDPKTPLIMVNWLNNIEDIPERRTQNLFPRTYQSTAAIPALARCRETIIDIMSTKKIKLVRFRVAMCLFKYLFGILGTFCRYLNLDFPKPSTLIPYTQLKIHTAEYRYPFRL